MRTVGMMMALVGVWSAAGNLRAADFRPTPSGLVVETDRYRATIDNGILRSFLNKLTNEQYLEPEADLAQVLPHLPGGLGTQNGAQAREAAGKLYYWGWEEFGPELAWPNQHHVTPASKLESRRNSDGAWTLTYSSLSDGRQPFGDETYTLRVQVENASGDLLITPTTHSSRPGVYAANLTISPAAMGITIEAPIFDGVRLTPDMPHRLWSNQWGGYWDYGFLAFNGRRRGAVGVWTQDAQMHYKTMFCLINGQGLSVSLSSMNTPPFDQSRDAGLLTWRIQAFDNSWTQAAARFREWRSNNMPTAKRPEWTRRISFVNSGVNASKMWLDGLKAYFGPDHLDRTVTFAPVIRAAAFDTRHWDNTPYAEFKKDMEAWHASGAKLMAYLQPMIMWGGGKPAPTDDERKIIALAGEADTRSIFKNDANTLTPHRDQHHLGHPQWQKWMLDWVHRYIAENGATGVYHDQAYPCPVDARGLVGGFRSTQGMADYFYKAATQDPDSIHGTEHLTECNITGASLGIGGGILWGTADSGMRRQRIHNASPVSSALHYPNAVIFGFPHFSDLVNRGDTTLFHWGMDQMEGRAEIPGFGIQNLTLYGGKTVPYDQWMNELWIDRQRALLFVNHGLRPVFPENWDRNVRSYFQGAGGEQFRYEQTPWGSCFVQIERDARTIHYARATGVTAAPTSGAVSGWVMYNDAGPAGLAPRRYYCIDPQRSRPAVYFSPAFQTLPATPPCDSLYESYVDDGLGTPTFAMLRIRPIDSIGAVIKGDRIKLHCPKEPLAVLVNNAKTTPVKETDGYSFGLNTPANVCVFLEDIPAGLGSLAKSAVLRCISSTNSDLFEAAYVTAMVKPEPLKVAGAANALPGLSCPASLEQAMGVAGRYQLHMPVKGPSEGPSTLRVHWRTSKPLQSLAVNGVEQGIAHDYMKEGAISIPLQPGESIIITLTSQAAPHVAMELLDSSAQQP